MGPDTPGLKDPDDSSPTRAAERKHDAVEEGGGEKELRAVGGCKWRFCFAPPPFFFPFQIKALLNAIQNQHVWPCREERRSCYLFPS